MAGLNPLVRIAVIRKESVGSVQKEHHIQKHSVFQDVQHA